ncbi:MAG: RNA methyltransferase [Chitinispirillaceae bacterium]|nr:RNA methyltransferase [Chitinispirillaceae bacterium]
MSAPAVRAFDTPPSVVYGIHAVESLLAARIESIDHIYIDKDKRSAPLFNLMKICRKERLAYNLVPAVRLGHIAGTADHQGIAAVCSIKPYCTPEELREKIRNVASPLFVLAASIEDPQNLGALIRSCAAFGVDALFLERRNTAPLSPAVAKASAGTIEQLTILRPKNLEGIIREFGEAGFSLVGTHAARGAAPCSIDLRGPVIILLGGEHRGIPPYLEKRCSSFANIAIDPRVQSLNVAATGAIMLYECSRQRARNDDRHF